MARLDLMACAGQEQFSVTHNMGSLSQPAVMMVVIYWPLLGTNQGLKLANATPMQLLLGMSPML